LPEYIYTSKSIDSKVFNGTIEAENLEGFYKIIKERSQFCIKVKELGAQSLSLSFKSNRLKLKDLSIFCRQFSTMLTAGLPVIKCLDILYQQTTNKQIKVVILGVYEAVQRGESLSKAMKSQKNAFPILLLNMVEAGEASGSLDTVMKRLAEQFEKDNKMSNKIQQALIYPLFLMVLSFVVILIMLIFVLPGFMKMFKDLGGTIPITTQILIGISNFILNYWYLLIIGIIFLSIITKLYLRSPAGRLNFDKLKLKIPVMGKLMMIVESSRFARTLASLFSSGLPIIQSLEIVCKIVKNAYMQESLYKVIEDVKRGTALSISVRKLNLFPIMLCSMLSIGEESGNMDDILMKTSLYYDEESDTAIAKMVTLIEPCMIVFLAVVVGFIIISIITPIYSIYSSINSGSGM